MLAFNRDSIPSMANTMGSFTSGFTTIVDILSDSSGIRSQRDVSFNFEKLVERLLPLFFLSSAERCLFLLITLFAMRRPVSPDKPAFLHSAMKVLMRGLMIGIHRH